MTDFVRKLNHKCGRSVEVTISPPIRQAGASGDWECTYQITGLGSAKAKIAMGVDGIQAVFLAMTYVATALYFSDEYENGELTWDGGMTVVDLGFPVTESVREDVEAKKVKVTEIIRTANEPTAR
ncbi:MAG: DUF6968 family protein [Caulobacteraceae bacterium]